MEGHVSKGSDHHSGGDVSHEESITFEILHVLKEAQGQHGLKHGDYQRYRQYCTRRLARIRKSLHYVQSSGSKNRSTFVRKMVSNELVCGAEKTKKDPIRYLFIPLMEAERSWAYAMQLKQEANTEPRKKFHLIRRLKKAVKAAAALEEICNSNPTRCDARTKLETQAYSAYFNGVLFFENEQWQEAGEYLKKAQTIYMKLCEAIADEEVAVYYKQRVEEIKPTLRYVAFNIGEQDIKDQDINKLQNEASNVEDEILSTKLDQLILQTREKQAVTLSEVQWLGKKLSIKQEKIRTFLLSAQEVTDNTKFAQLENIIFECRDCLQLLRESNQEKSPLFVYLSYLRLQLTVKRNVQLVKTLKNSSDLIRPYEVIISCLTEMKSLPMDQHFAGDQVESMIEEMDAQIVVYQAYRCYYIGKVSKSNWKESVALLHRCTHYCKIAIEDENTPKDMKEALKQLMAKAEGDKYAIYANSLMKNDDEKTFSKDEKLPPLIERLETYHEDNRVLSASPNLVNFPPEFRPIPCKPLFFDLALNHIKFPSLEEEKANQKGSGITGFVKGLWGGWRN